MQPKMDPVHQEIIDRMVEAINELYSHYEVQVRDDLYRSVSKVDFQLGRLQDALTERN